MATWVFGREFGIPLNILFTLGLGADLASVLCRQLPDRWWWSSVFVVPTVLLLSPFVEYGAPGVLLVATVAFSAWAVRHDSWGALLPVVGAFWLVWHVNSGGAVYGWIAVGALTLAALVTLRGESRVGDRWFFYAYYPLHLVVLGLGALLFV